jgi:hypothetical protein
MDFNKEHFSIDLFAIINKEVHIFGTLWRDYEDIHNTTYRSTIIPLNEFVEGYKKEGEDFIYNTLQVVQQYEGDNISANDAEEIFNTYFNGVGPEAELNYYEITTETPDGNYYTAYLY